MLVISLAEVVEDIELIRQQLGIESMYVLGHSGHGFMAMAYAEKYGEHVEGIILSNLAPTNTQERQDASIVFLKLRLVRVVKTTSMKRLPS